MLVLLGIEISNSTETEEFASFPLKISSIKQLRKEIEKSKELFKVIFDSPTIAISKILQKGQRIDIGSLQEELCSFFNELLELYKSNYERIQLISTEVINTELHLLEKNNDQDLKILESSKIEEINALRAFFIVESNKRLSAINEKLTITTKYYNTFITAMMTDEKLLNGELNNLKNKERLEQSAREELIKEVSTLKTENTELIESLHELQEEHLSLIEKNKRFISDNHKTQKSYNENLKNNQVKLDKQLAKIIELEAEVTFLNEKLNAAQCNFESVKSENDLILDSLYSTQELFELSQKNLSNLQAKSEVQATSSRGLEAWFKANLISTNLILWKKDRKFQKKTNDQAKKIEQSSLFDETYYLSQLSSNDLNLKSAVHYLLIGVYEGKNPSSACDSMSYLRDHLDVAQHGFNPLVHYLEYGLSENRKFNSTGISNVSSKDD